MVLLRDSIYHICLVRYMLSPVRPSVCQMPSSVHTGSRWLVVSVVEFHAHVTVQLWYETSMVRNVYGTKRPRKWYEKSVVRRVRKIHRWYEKSMVRNVYGTNSLWYEKSGSRHRGLGWRIGFPWWFVALVVKRFAADETNV